MSWERERWAQGCGLVIGSGVCVTEGFGVCCVMSVVAWCCGVWWRGVVACVDVVLWCLDKSHGCNVRGQP